MVGSAGNTCPPRDFLSINFPKIQHFKKFAFDDTISAKFYGRLETTRTRAIRCVLEISSLGIAHLLLRWFPRLESMVTTEGCEIVKCSHLFIVNSFGQSELIAVERAKVSDEEYNFFLEECCMYRSSFAEDIKSSPLICAPSDIEAKNMIVSLDYRCNRFIVNPLSGNLMSIHDVKRIPFSDVDVCEEGLKSESMVACQRLLFGRNELSLNVKGKGQLLVDEILHPFNVFQLFSIIVWSCEDYYYYAVIILIMTSGSIVVTFYDTLRNQQKLKQMATFSCIVKVLREGSWTECMSEELVPGDVINLDSIQTVPCDLILLNGDAVVDESMLTGETVPLTKSSISYEEFREFYTSNHNSSSYSLFSGTHLLRSRPRYGRPATGLVLNTGFLTAKGSLVQSIMFPRPNKFRFYRDSMIFVGVLGAIATLGFIFSIFIMLHLNYGWWYIVTRALDLITVVIPPALPATMSIGAIFALNRLKQQKIFCISPPRINVCAKIELMCFDKTGTLTQEGLDVLGVVPALSASPSEHRAPPIAPIAPLLRLTASVAQQNRALVQLMATCHSIQKINEELVGDPLDLKMFAFSGWILDEVAEDCNEGIVPIIIRPPGSESFDLENAMNSSDNDDNDHGKSERDIHPLQEMAIIRCFEFHAGIRRISVIARELNSEKMMVMTKGSPESLKSICMQETIPPDYDQILAQYSHSGFRVIACAYRELAEGTTWLRVQRMPREQVERDLRFLGFLLFENKLKDQTTNVIRTLQVAGITTIMVTGDNLYTAVAVARSCGMISSNSSVLVPVEYNDCCTNCGEENCVESSENPKLKGLWESLESGLICSSDADLLPNSSPSATASFTLAMTGTSFEKYLQSFSFETLRPVMSHCRVFARMSPQQKQTLVELFQSYNLTVGFCGDGANDCGALKAADVGISLSAAEASVAAPFTSRQQHIGCVVDLLREGRAALATSFSCFKFMALYSMIQFTTLTLMYLFRTSLTDGQFIYIDLFLIVPFGILLSRFGPAPIIHPCQPAARLISAPVLLSIFGQVVLQWIVQLAITWVVASRFGFTDLTSDKPSSLGNTSLFLSSVFLYSTVALVFSFGHPHRQRSYLPFTIFILLTFLLAFCFCCARISFLDWFLSLNDVLAEDGLLFLVLSGVHLFLAVLYETLLVPPLSGLLKRWAFRGRGPGSLGV